jgi:signal recognition particle subunit SRP19
MVSRGSDRVVLWPCYFDAQLSRAQGRRVPADAAVRGPDARFIEVAAKRLQLDPVVEEAARHPSIPYERSGRVLVAKRQAKQQAILEVGRKMHEMQASNQREG